MLLILGKKVAPVIETCDTKLFCVPTPDWWLEIVVLHQD